MENAESGSTSGKSGPKTGVILIVVLLLLLVGGAAYLLLKNTTSNIATTTSKPKKASPTSANMFSSIQDALAKSISLQCNYSDETSRKTIAYMKAGAIRSDTTGKNPQDEASIIMKNNKMYFWSGKQGTMMEFNVSEMTAKVTPGSQKTTSTKKPGDVIESLEKFKQQCKPATVADSLFTPPADVKFTDLSEMMKSGSTGTQSGVGTAMTEEQLKKLQEQYQPQQ